MSLRCFFIGWIRLGTDGTHAPAILNLCMRYRLVYSRFHTDPCTGEICFDLSAASARFLCRRCADHGIPIRILHRGGLPHLLMLYRHRAGLLIGAMLGLAILLASGRILWDIRVSGNESLTTRQVLRELTASGMYIGMPLSALNTDRAEMQIQLDSDLISWVSVNMAGTVAYVEIRERVPTPEKAPLQPANLLARCEGVVEGLEIYAGCPVVQVGQGVQEGELLVSGLFDSQAVGWRVTRAAGRVLARTVHEFSVEIPLEYEQKEYIGDPITQKTLIFFEKEIKLFKNTGISGITCDKIYTEYYVRLPGGFQLPLAFTVTETTVYDESSAQTSAFDTESLMQDYAQKYLFSQMVSGRILHSTASVDQEKNVHILSGRYLCSEMIGRTQTEGLLNQYGKDN